MKPTPTAAPADPVLLILLALWLAAEALAVLLIAAAALLLTLAGWRPTPPPARPVAAPQPALLPPAPVPPSPAPLEGLRVVELRTLARRRGLPQLARSGRRAELLQALAAAPG
jgi:hypothetical protein